MDLLLIILFVITADARMFCEKTKAPLELGQWQYSLKHMDSAVVENPAVSINEGQVYVYENYFPGYTIRYIHVDNLAIRTCGASASIKAGGVGASSVLIVLRAYINQEIRSVIDIWGEKKVSNNTNALNNTQLSLNPEEVKNINYNYLFKDTRALNHNRQNLH
ncbi:hypothetical protein B5X24_HaOG204432 [Helicoverpa armigera]|uniref:Uncharacterized protein n=1 Tax=Helicoverpa armigera TaxID=29058 RepID=A0A2W1BNF3_HELAM|nr:hypothetical protein B5X24_HaOG204432 [Helicoverpa armigera]